LARASVSIVLVLLKERLDPILLWLFWFYTVAVDLLV